MKKFSILCVVSVICIILAFCFRGVWSRPQSDPSSNNIDVTQNSKQLSETDKIYKSGPVLKDEEIKNTNTSDKNSLEKVSSSDPSLQTEQVHKKTENQAEASGTKQSSSLSKPQNLSNKKENEVYTLKANREIDAKKPMVALTFDDGPHYKYTKSILDSLDKYNGVATFFVLGDRAESNKDLIKRMAEGGNQIGNHTYDHKYLTKLSTTEINNELNKTSDIIYNIAKVRPSVLRPTYGAVNDNVKQNANLPLILWSVDTRDWQSRNEKSIVNKALKNVKDGQIILMHDIYKTTASAADVIMKELTSKGYQLVTIDELFQAKDKDLVNGTVYSHAY